MHACMHACMDGWMDGWMDVCMYVCMYVCHELMYVCSEDWSSWEVVGLQHMLNRLSVYLCEGYLRIWSFDGLGFEGLHT